MAANVSERHQAASPTSWPVGWDWWGGAAAAAFSISNERQEAERQEEGLAHLGARLIDKV